MTLTDKDGREVEIQVGGDHSDDISIESAEYTSDGERVPDHILEWLEQAYAGEIFEEWLQVRVAQVEWMADIWKDGTHD